MPPPHPHGPHGLHGRVPVSEIDAAVDREAVAEILEPWIRDDRDRAFVVRCILDEGPAHHRGATYALLRMLGEAVRRRGGRPTDGPTVAVPMSVPPHLRRGGDAVFPLRMPLSPLGVVAAPDSPASRALADCLTDGPPHHALANAAMVCLLSALLGDFGE